MEFLILLGVVVLMFFFVKWGKPKGTRPPPVQPVKRTPRAQTGTGRPPAPPKTSPSQRSRASAGKRITSGIEHDPPPEIPISRKLIGRAWVIDGDTIAINRIKVRLAGIDAPELDEPWGRKSKWAMVNLCKGQTIHVDLTGETSYDRLVGTCYLPDGTDVGAELVKEGLALDGGYYSKGKYRHLEPEGARQRLGRYGLRQHRT